MKHAEQIVHKTASAQPGAYDFTGTWTNELGSTLTIEVHRQDIKGRYVSAVSETGGAAPPYPLTGTVSGELITFFVNWGDEITSWVGHGVRTKTGMLQILTLWHIVKVVPGDLNPNTQWKMISAGADEFTKSAT